MGVGCHWWTDGICARWKTQKKTQGISCSHLTSGGHRHLDCRPGHGSIICDDQRVTISDDELRFDVSADVTNIQVIGDTVIGINQDNCVNFVINTSKRTITLLENDKRISTMIDNGQIKILTLNEFYWESRKIPYMIGTVIILIVIILALFLLWKIGLFSLRKESNNP